MRDFFPGRFVRNKIEVKRALRVYIYYACCTRAPDSASMYLILTLRLIVCISARVLYNTHWHTHVNLFAMRIGGCLFNMKGRRREIWGRSDVLSTARSLAELELSCPSKWKRALWRQKIEISERFREIGSSAWRLRYSPPYSAYNIYIIDIKCHKATSIYLLRHVLGVCVRMLLLTIYIA